MRYSEELTREVRRLYPNDTRFNDAAMGGYEILGRYLDDSSCRSISIETILTANSLKELQDKAWIEKDKLDLYKLWCKEYQEHRNK